MSTYPQGGVLTSQVFATFDAGKPQISEMLNSRYGTQYESMFLKFANMGRQEPVQAKNWYHYEDNWIHDTIVVSAAVTAPVDPADSMDFVLDATKVYGDDYSFYPRVGDIVFTSESKAGWISAIDETAGVVTITLLPVDAEQGLDDLTEGQELGIITAAFGEGTGQPNGTVYGTVKREFQLQIIKETTGLDGSQFINELWFKKYDEHGNVEGYFTTGTLRGEYLFKLKTDGALTVGIQNNNDALIQERQNIHGVGLGKYSEVRTTKGMIPWIKSLGDTMNYTSGAFDLVDLDDEGLYLRSQGVSSSAIYTALGAVLYNDVQNAAKDYAIDTTGDGSTLNSVLSVVGKGNKEVATSLNFKYIHRGNFHFMLDTVDAWSHPKYLGVATYEMDKKGVFIPLKTVRDAASGQAVDNIHVKYRGNLSYNRRAEMWSVKGAGGGVYVTDVDTADFFVRGEVGLGLLGANQMTYIAPEAGE